MMKKLATGLLLFVVLFTGSVVAEAFFFHRQITLHTSRVARELRERSYLIAGALGKVTSEFERKGKEMNVVLSSVMYDAVRESKERSDEFTLDEIFYLDRNRKLIAHNDVSKIAKGSKNDFAADEYLRPYDRTPVQPIGMTNVESLPDDPSIPGAVYRRLKQRYPKLFVIRTHVSVSVFPVDSDVVIGAVHLFFHHTRTESYFQALKKKVLLSVLGALSGAAVVSFVLVFLLFLERTGGSAHEVVEEVKIPPGIQIYEPGFDEETAGVHAKEAEVQTEILDAIPLDPV